MRHLVISVLALALGACADDTDAPAKTAYPEGAMFVADDPSCTAPRCFEMEIPLPAGIAVVSNRVRVLVPQDYAVSDKRYPVLYLLHDAPGNYLSWTQLGLAQEATAGLDVIAIMPDGGGGNPGWYSDWLDGSYQYESYHVGTMIPYLEQRLRVLGDGHRAVAGPSMGGFGSMYYSSKYPGLFVAAAAFSGAVDFLAVDRASALVGYLMNPAAGTPDDAIWGDPVTHYDVWQAHDPGTHVEGLAGMKLFLASGNGLPGGPHEDLAHPQLYTIEPLVYVMNLTFEQALGTAGVEHETLFYGPGFHDWPYYRDDFAWALPKLMAEITPPG